MSKLSELWERALSNFDHEEREALLKNVSSLTVCELPESFYLSDNGYNNGMSDFFTLRVVRREDSYVILDKNGNLYNSNFENSKNVPEEEESAFRKAAQYPLLQALMTAEEISLNKMVYRPHREAYTAAEIIELGSIPKR